MEINKEISSNIFTTRSHSIVEKSNGFSKPNFFDNKKIKRISTNVLNIDDIPLSYRYTFNNAKEIYLTENLKKTKTYVEKQNIKVKKRKKNKKHIRPASSLLVRKNNPLNISLSCSSLEMDVNSKDNNDKDSGKNTNIFIINTQNNNFVVPKIHNMKRIKTVKLEMPEILPTPKKTKAIPHIKTDSNIVNFRNQKNIQTDYNYNPYYSDQKSYNTENQINQFLTDSKMKNLKKPKNITTDLSELFTQKNTNENILKTYTKKDFSKKLTVINSDVSELNQSQKSEVSSKNKKITDNNSTNLPFIKIKTKKKGKSPEKKQTNEANSKQKNNFMECSNINKVINHSRNVNEDEGIYFTNNKTNSNNNTQQNNSLVLSKTENMSKSSQISKKSKLKIGNFFAEDNISPINKDLNLLNNDNFSKNSCSKKNEDNILTNKEVESTLMKAFTSKSKGNRRTSCLIFKNRSKRKTSTRFSVSSNFLNDPYSGGYTGRKSYEYSLGNKINSFAKTHTFKRNSVCCSLMNSSNLPNGFTYQQLNFIKNNNKKLNIKNYLNNCLTSVSNVKQKEEDFAISKQAAQKFLYSIIKNEDFKFQYKSEIFDKKPIIDEILVNINIKLSNQIEEIDDKLTLCLNNNKNKCKEVFNIKLFKIPKKIKKNITKFVGILLYQTNNFYLNKIRNNCLDMNNTAYIRSTFFDLDIYKKGVFKRYEEEKSKFRKNKASLFDTYQLKPKTNSNSSKSGLVKNKSFTEEKKVVRRNINLSKVNRRFVYLKINTVFNNYVGLNDDFDELFYQEEDDDFQKMAKDLVRGKTMPKLSSKKLFKSLKRKLGSEKFLNRKFYSRNAKESSKKTVETIKEEDEYNTDKKQDGFQFKRKDEKKKTICIDPSKFLAKRNLVSLKDFTVIKTHELQSIIQKNLKTKAEHLFYLVKVKNYTEFVNEYKHTIISPNITDTDNNTLLNTAVQSNCFDIAEFLLKMDADANIPNSRKNYPLHYALCFRNFHMADLLLLYGAQENVQNADGFTPWECIDSKKTIV